MTPAGYSKRSLAEKLGFKPGHRILILHAPDSYRRILGKLPEGARVLAGRAGRIDLIHLFSRSRADLEREFGKAKRRLKPDGMLWVSWPKLSSSQAGDLTENVVRDIGLAHGLVDVKVAAIDQDWSGLKFVYRLQDRPK